MKNFYRLFSLFFSLYFLISCTTSNEENNKNFSPPDSILASRTMVFGLDVTSLEMFEDSVKRNQTFSDILQEHNVPFQRILEIVNSTKDTFDIRKMRVNNAYKIYSEIDSVERVKYIIYEKDPINVVIYDIEDSIKVFDHKKEIKIIEKCATGVINNSLYQTLDEKNLHPTLAIEMSEVFAWQIDFYRIMKGDNFKIVYEEGYVDGRSIGISKIKSAYFNHSREDFYAFRFEKEGSVAYYDEEGNSLQKQFLKSPLKFTRISSGFSYSRLHPVLKVRKPHTGIDMAAAVGTPVRAVGDGIITKARYEGAAGRYVKIRHNGTYTSGYMHLSKYGTGIKVGKKVRQGDIIGYVGSSGRSTGPHLDFRFWIGGSPKNYLKMKFPPTKPVEEKYKLEYDELKNHWFKILSRMKILSPEETAFSIAP